MELLNHICLNRPVWCGLCSHTAPHYLPPLTASHISPLNCSGPSLSKGSDMHNSTSSVDIASFGSRALPLQCSLSQRDFCLPFMCSGPNDQDADGATTTYHSWTVMTPMSFAALQRGASSEYLKGFVTGVIAISMFGQDLHKLSGWSNLLEPIARLVSVTALRGVYMQGSCLRPLSSVQRQVRPSTTNMR